ncbi:TPA: transposase domain-containing protein [Escherichia coli]|nr:transposase domain-containing protein [Escherichia coli]HEL8044724.1 transposase domain-containing protein [Escherichia coli]HEL8045270.1 transposase domain-containing protein [Escherichia coli]HEL8054252.1 transposase domain-containing protein [Escherichia coli]HEL8059096.1 transposase domain-containing protein [Escherichia coli]
MMSFTKEGLEPHAWLTDVLTHLPSWPSPRHNATEQTTIVRQRSFTCLAENAHEESVNMSFPDITG